MVDKDHPSLDDLDERLRRLKADVEPKRRVSAAAEPTTGLGMAIAMASHLVAGVGVGAFIGYLLDRWLQTAPLLLIVLLFLGAAGGILNIYRTATRQGMALGYRPGGSTTGPPPRRSPGDGNETGPAARSAADRTDGNSGRSDRETTRDGS